MNIVGQISEYLLNQEDDLISFRRELHEAPELSNKEFETTNKIASFLEKAGIEVHRFKKSTGLFVNIQGGNYKDKPLVLIRGDIDALPIQDLKICSYKSQNDGVMHACGHDVHATIIIGVLLALNKLKDKLDFNVRAIFQPAEEIGTGAHALIDQGVLEGVDSALSLHVDPLVPLGQVAIRSGSVNAEVIEFELVVKGKTTHAARVHQGIDVIGPASNFVTTCYSHVPKKIDSRDPNLLYFGVFNSGTASNIVSDEARLLGTIRAFTSEVAIQVYEEVQKVGKSIADYTDTVFKFHQKVHLKAVVNDKNVSGFLKKGAIDVLGEENIVTNLPTSLGGEDFGAIMSIVPGAMMRLGVKPKHGMAHGLHTSEFDVPESVIVIGAKILTNAIFKVF